MSKTISNHVFNGISYDLPCETTAPLHIPEGWTQPPAGYDISWDTDGTPSYYHRDTLKTAYFNAQVLVEPTTGIESVNVDFNLEAPAEDARVAMGQLLAWFHVAVESHLPAGEGK